MVSLSVAGWPGQPAPQGLIRSRPSTLVMAAARSHRDRPNQPTSPDLRPSEGFNWSNPSTAPLPAPQETSPAYQCYLFLLVWRVFAHPNGHATTPAVQRLNGSSPARSAGAVGRLLAPYRMVRSERCKVVVKCRPTQPETESEALDEDIRLPAPGKVRSIHLRTSF